MITRRNLLSGMAAAGLMHGLPLAGPSAMPKAKDDWAVLFKDALAENPLLLGWRGVDGAPLDSGALDITGAWPKDLSGRFWRNGPVGNGTPHYANVKLPLGRDGVIKVASNIMEFTKIAPRGVGQRHNYVYGLSAAATNAFPFNQLIKRNSAADDTETYTLDGHIIAEEHVFVPRLSQKAEDDGWLIGTHLDM